MREHLGVLVRDGPLGDLDAHVVDEVVGRDCYGLWRFSGVDAGLVVDVGAHVGAFAVLARRVWPRAYIVCCEACPENEGPLRANARRAGASVTVAACTYAGGPLALLNSVTAARVTATGGSVVVPLGARPADDRWSLDARPLRRVTLEDLAVRPPDVLKLDCEGSEASIVSSSPSVPRVGAIVGEYHGWDEWQAARKRLGGWFIEEDGRRPIGLFTAVNMG